MSDSLLRGNRAGPAWQRLTEHPDAPRWNHRAGDGLRPQDRQQLLGWQACFQTGRSVRAHGQVPASVLASLHLQWPPRLPRPNELAAQWHTLPTSSREDLALRPESLVPDGANLAEMLVYRTAGTTGHALLVPHHAAAAACYLPMLEFAAARHGAHWQVGPEVVAAVLLGAQQQTVTYPCTLSLWGDAGFAKVNLACDDWPQPDSPLRYLEALQPCLFSGDPISLAKLLELVTTAPGARKLRPKAVVSTAVAMGTSLRRRLEEVLAAPVIDWYSLTETGPLGYRCPLSEDYHVLPHDIHVEVLGPQGELLPAGQRGEVTVSGGRNPYLPLLRYRTGDFGSLDYGPCPCGDPMPRLVDLEGRVPVVLRDHRGQLANPVDLSRVLRDLPLVQHHLHQSTTGAVQLRLRPIAPADFDLSWAVAAVRQVLGPVAVEVAVDETLGQRIGKAPPYTSDWRLDD